MVVLRDGDPIAQSSSGRTRRRRTVVCKCDCGNTKTVRLDQLQCGDVKSCRVCGYQSEQMVARLTRHGMHDSKEYEAWEAMKGRCYNPNYFRYKDYGGRGIRVCDRWMVFENFYADMGPRPPGTSNERRNNDGDYGPDNCYWATAEEQANNKRSSRLLEFNGVTQTVARWSRAIGVSQKTIGTRLANGWSVEQALTTPTQIQFRNKKI